MRLDVDGDPIELFLSVCEKPGMYIHSWRFDAVWSFIEGFDSAWGTRPLEGFREWLIVERGEWTNLPWFMIIRDRVYPDSDPGAFPTGDEHEGTA